MADDLRRQKPEAPPRPLLTVHDTFEDYVRGDQIDDPKEATRVLAAYPQFVTRLPTGTESEA